VPTGKSLARLTLAVDALGEPPAHLHPTVWMGRWIATGRRVRRSRSALPSLLEGALVVGSGLALTGLIAGIASRSVDRLPRVVRRRARALLLKPSLSLEALLGAASEVESALAIGNLPEARRLLSWHLVSRDTTTLSAAEVAGAAIESVAENLGDSVVAPLLAFAIGGVPGAYLYRFANTADAMLGYRTPELEWFGKFAAHLDDVLSFVPSRLSAQCIATAASAGGGSRRTALACARRDGPNTPSPNAGWPMAAMAGALGGRLPKRAPNRGYLYVLNPSGRPPTARDLGRARRIVRRAAWIAATLMATLESTEA
jgi:adenosylcobinamide-phosphate synthase